jgi:hypothetical protein
MVHRGGGVTREASERLPMSWAEHTRLPGAGGKSERVRAPFVTTGCHSLCVSITPGNFGRVLCE